MEGVVAVVFVVVVDFLASTKKHLAADLGQTANVVAVFVTHSCCSEPLVARYTSH